MRRALLLLALAACSAKPESSPPTATAAFWCRPDGPGVNECWRNRDACDAAPSASGAACVSADGAWCRSEVSGVDGEAPIETCTISESDCHEVGMSGREQDTTVQDCTWTQ